MDNTNLSRSYLFEENNPSLKTTKIPTMTTIGTTNTTVYEHIMTSISTCLDSWSDMASEISTLSLTSSYNFERILDVLLTDERKIFTGVALVLIGIISLVIFMNDETN